MSRSLGIKYQGIKIIIIIITIIIIVILALQELTQRFINITGQDLEAERTKLMAEVAANKRKMKELEDNLLYHLTSTTGSLVEDETLIEALTVTKETAHEVTEKLSVAAETEVRINSAREEFRPGATFLSNLSVLHSIFYILIQCILQNSCN